MPSITTDEFHQSDILGEKSSYWQQLGAGHTAREIQQQPRLWKDSFRRVLKHRTELDNFLDQAYAIPDLEIILTGAGTSAFIGEILAGPFQLYTKKKASAYPTTNLITHPQHYFDSDRPLLLISFARSGNSPESMAAVDIANQYCRKIYHLIITCSPSGRLALNTGRHPSFVFLLPEKANDQGLAMTGSFSCMLLAGLLIARIKELPLLEQQVDQLCAYGERILSHYTEDIRKAARLGFDRAVFLGSGPLYGTAHESHLKVQELTDGQTICKFDSFLGLRHGPKVVISPSTIILYLFSNDHYVHQYETDLVRSINRGEKGLYQIAISEHAGKDKGMADLSIVLSPDETSSLHEDFLSICTVVPAQLLGFFKSLELGLEPDQPSRNGTITRVVQGVTIYPTPAPFKVNNDR